MRVRGILTAAATLSLVGGMVSVQAAKLHLNPMVDLLANKQPVFGLYAPSNPRNGGGRGAAGSP